MAGGDYRTDVAIGRRSSSTTLPFPELTPTHLPWRSTWESRGTMCGIGQDRGLQVALLLLFNQLVFIWPAAPSTNSQQDVRLLINQCLVVVDRQQLNWIWDWKSEEDEKECTAVDAEKKNYVALDDKQEAKRKRLTQVIHLRLPLEVLVVHDLVLRKWASMSQLERCRMQPSSYRNTGPVLRH